MRKKLAEVSGATKESETLKGTLKTVRARMSRAESTVKSQAKLISHLTRALSDMRRVVVSVTGKVDNML